MRPLCIYHGDCFDGFTAAWAVWKRFGHSFDYHAGQYDKPPPDVRDRHVFIVDFSYKRDVLEEMSIVTRSLIVLDHHKTAAADLAGYPEPLPLIALAYGEDWPEWAATRERRIQALFDMNRSGAGIAWDYFHADDVRGRPPLINHVEDRDLWRFDLPFTREIHAGLSQYPFGNFGAWDEAAILCVNGELAKQGAAIDRKHLRDVDVLLKQLQHRMTIGGVDVPVANLPVTMVSDAGNIMAQGEPFAACFYDIADGRCFSLRSTDGGVDVSEIAKRYGGGGHAKAAGFMVPHGTTL